MRANQDLLRTPRPGLTQGASEKKVEKQGIVQSFFSCMEKKGSKEMRRRNASVVRVHVLKTTGNQTLLPSEKFGREKRGESPSPAYKFQNVP